MNLFVPVICGFWAFGSLLINRVLAFGHILQRDNDCHCFQARDASLVYGVYLILGIVGAY